MDPVKILKRAWHILWNYRTLWVFGLILALTAAGSAGGSGNSGSRFNINGSDQQYDMPFSDELNYSWDEAGEAFEREFEEGLSAAGISQGDLTALLWIGAAFILVMLVMGIVMAFARYVSETAVIRMVNEYESTDTKMSVRQGFRIGWSRTSWRLFLINLIVNLPAFLLLGVLVIAGFMIYAMVSGSNENFAIAGTIGLIGIVFLAIFVVALMSIILRLLRHFFWRVCALEDVGVRESLRRGYQMVRENWKNIGVMWLVMMGVGIAWMIVSFVAVIITLPILLITIVIGAAVAIIPGLLLVGFFSLFLSGYLPWIVGGLFALPLFFIIAFSPWILLSAWERVYTSTVWTLVYREINALLTLTPETDVVELLED